MVLLNVVDSKDNRKEARAAVVNMSPGGAAFESSIKFPRGRKVILRFTIDDKKAYVVDGVVKRVEQKTGSYIHGVKFKNLNFIEKIKLRLFIYRISR